jgi:RNA polymerase sigma factor (sigma-70 family)
MTVAREKTPRRAPPGPAADVPLLRAARSGDRGAREWIVRRHLGLVRRIARHYTDLGLPLDDLVQEGSIGLLDAIDRFDPGYGVEFSTFAGWRARAAILNALTDRSRLVRLPKQVVERRRALARADAALTARNGHAPSDSELSAATGLPHTAVARDRRSGQTVTSLDAPLSSDGASLAAALPDPAARDPELVAVSEEEAHLLDKAVAQLSARQREVVTRHFGLGRATASLSQVAADLDLSRQRTRAIERDALCNLRTRLERAGLAR